MRKIKAKTPDSLTQLAGLAFRKYSPALHRYVLHRIQQKAEVADLTQEIFERFLRIDKAEIVRNPQAYLFGIASHVVSDARMKEDKSLVTFDSEAASLAGETLSRALPDDMADRVAVAQDLKFALSRLPATHRAVLLLVKRDGLSYEEAARRMQLTVATVTLYVFEARAKVKMLLKNRQGQ